MAKGLTPDEKITIASYDAIASDWAAAHSDLNFWEKEFAIFRKYLPTGKIIEIGSGGGRDARVLAAAGYDYTGTDVSQGLIAAAKKNNPQLNFLQQSAYKLDFPDNSFDGFWTAATILHIPKLRINEALQEIHHVVKPNGIGFISTKLGHGENTEEEEEFGILTKKKFIYYQPDELNGILEKNNYQVLEWSIRPISHKTTWLIFLVKVQK